MSNLNYSHREDESLASSTSSCNNSNEEDVDTTTGTGTGGNMSNTGSSGGEKELKERVIAQEQRAVRMARLGVMAAVVVAAAVVASLVYVFARRSDTNTFEVEYERVSSTLVDQVQLQVQYNFAFMQMLSADMTTAALLSKPNFPNFTHPQFEIHGGYTDGMGGIMVSAYVPFILATEQQEWEDYSVQNQMWLNESSRLRQVHPGHRDPLKGTFQSYEGDRRRMLQGDLPNEPNIHPRVFHMMEDGTKHDEPPTDAYKILAPLWQSSPRNPDVVNANLMRDSRIEQMIGIVMQVNHTVMSPASEIGILFDWMFDEHEKYRKKEPHTFLLDLVYPSFDDDPGMEPVGFVLGLTSYRNFFDKSLPVGTEGIVVVLEEPCAQPFSYIINGKNGQFLGFGDHHDRDYDKYLIEVPLEMFVDVDDPILCPHILKIYPSKVFEEKYKTNQAWVFTGVVLAAFAMTSFMLVVYDILVTRRQNKTMQAAIRTNRIVTQLFPRNVRERLLADHDNATKAANEKLGKANKFLPNDAYGPEFDQDGKFNTPPIADFFPDTTVLFADLVGFTAWSSVREPAQVFTLLETIYHGFDRIAKRRKIFKVETVGDCYVAVCGLPNPRRDHAVAMARFAKDCMACTDAWVKRLELSLGPDTADLTMRMGLHSGPVTGGVLRGERSRFQLFGDTMNTTARIESTGAPRRIHISKETADLLVAAGKESWLTHREDKVMAKGKGEMITFWLNLNHSKKSDNASTSSGGSHAEVGIKEKSETNAFVKSEAPAQKVDAKMTRLVGWNVDVLLRLLKQVVAQRKAIGGTKSSSTAKALKSNKDGNTTVLDEVAEIITLPKFNKAASGKNDFQSIELPKAVHEQLENYITNICGMYRDNPFHNFEHASHVTMSVTKLLSRIVTTTDGAMTKAETKEDTDAALLHDHTYGITSDPLTQFSCVLSALIHDADHPGVPNAQLVKEGALIAEYYKGKSVAEQNSVDIAWDLLMDERYTDLRACIYSNDEAEMLHFRQLIVNAVMATDIVDKDLKQLRNARWEKAFSEDHVDEDVSQSVNRKATIVIEHLIQASDVAHTMQHWHIYRKWNERLFFELYKAYKDGRGGDKDPSEFWYKGEIGFFDFYIIPLAKKLKDCGVFGVSSDEYLNYAVKNRAEWEARGLEVVEELKAKAVAQFG